MNRPLYESDGDVKREGEVLKELESRWGYRFVKVPIKYGFDYAVLRGRDVLGVAEIKCRNYRYEELDRLGGYMLGLHKVGMMRVSGLAGVLVVKLVDEVYWTKDISGRVVVGGRRDRGDPEDIEPCVLVPMERFKRL